MPANFVPGAGPALPDNSSTFDWLVAQVTYLLATVANLLLGSPFITQSTWFVDSVNGDDANDGTTALTAIKTLGELTRRTEGRVLSPSISLFSVNLSGTFSTEPFALNFTVTAYCLVKITAPTRVDYAGSITNYTTYSAGVTAALLDDAAAAFAAGDVAKRVRLTSGASTGAVTFILKNISGTQVRVGDFYFYNATSGYSLPTLTATPANGTTYVVEELTCEIAGCDIVLDGGHAALLIDGVNWVRAPSPITRTTLRIWCGGLTTSAKLFGCKFSTTAVNMSINNSVCVMVSCVNKSTGSGNLIVQDGSVQVYGACVMGPLTVTANGNLLVQSLYQQGGGDAPTFSCDRNANVRQSGNFASYEMTGDAGVTVDDGASFVSFGGLYWSLTPAASYGIRCRGFGVYAYTTKPTATGAVNDTIVGGTATAYAAIPWVNPANNCAIVARA